MNGNLNFGNVNVGSSRQLTFTISNSGNSPLTVNSITYPAGFSGNWSGGIITASGYVTVTVTFAPTAAQTYSGTVTVNSDKTSGTNTLQISGTGTEVTRIINLSGNLAFGDVTVNTSKQLTFTISNTGNSPLTVSLISYPLCFTGNWSGGTIPAGGSQTVTVTFKPTAVQTYSGIVTVNSDKTGGINTISVSGAGKEVPISYTISGYVMDSANAGISGVTLTFSNSGGTATTDSSGFYSKAFNAAWTGTVTPSKSGYSFSPANRSYSNVTTNQAIQNYTGALLSSAFRIWIDKNGNRAYDSGEGVSGASVRVNNETTDRGTADSEGIIALQNVGNDAKIYAQKTFYSMSNPKADDANFGGSRNPYYAGSVNGKMYEFVMASDIMAADGTYFDFPGGQGRTLANAAKDAPQGNVLVQLVHPKIAWNLVVVFQEAQSAAFYDQIKSGFRSYADYMYNYTDGYFVVKNVVLVKGAYLNSAQWNYSDVQVRNSEWPNASVFGNRYNWTTRISMGKEWSGSLPDGYNWYSALGHESGHYLLGFYDEYVNGDYSKGGQFGYWEYRDTHNGGPGEPNEFPQNYGLMESQYNGVHEMSDPTDYFQTYSPSIQPDHATAQFARLPCKYIPADEPVERKGKSCWSFFKWFYEDDIKNQMAGQGFSDAFFSNLIAPPHTTGSYPNSDRSKRNYPAAMNHDSVNIIEWNLSGARGSRQSEDVFGAVAVVMDESENPVPGADVWLVSSDGKSFQGKSDRKGIVKCGSLLVGKRLEAYFEGRKAEIRIDAVEESYVLILPRNRISRRDDVFSGMVISAKPDSSDSKHLTITASGDSLDSAPIVTLSQSFGYSQNISMIASGADEYSGVADCQYNSGILEVSSGGNESISPFEIFSTEVGPASGYYAPNGELEMVYSTNTFSGTGSFVIVNSSMPAPMNEGMIQVGNVYNFGFSDAVTPIGNVILNIRLPEGATIGNPNLYGWDIQNKTWNLIPGGESGLRYFSISLESMDYEAYALFTLPQANDPTPPEPVTGFTASTGTSLWSVNLEWTTPDDTDVLAYDIRFNTVPVTEDNWSKCISAGNIPKPTAPGTIQSFTTEMPDPGVEYYFGIIVIDQSRNESSLASLSSPVTSQATDADGDGIYDLWEISRGLDTDVNDAQNDDDGDGLTNLQEYQYHTDPKDSDTDRDGYSDGDEISQGTDPADYTSHPELSSFDAITGVFKVGKDGVVKVDYLYDGGMYEGELGIFSLAGMDSLEPNSPEFIAEAVKRVLSNSEQGSVVISDRTQGARFSGQLGSGKEPDRNKGVYKGLKSCNMKPGDTFATVLVPNSTFAALSGNPATTDPAKRPIFSLASSNPEHEMYFGQIAKIKDGDSEFVNAVVYEDMLLSSGSDRDYNDLIVHFSGVTLSAPTLDNPELGFKDDWRKSQNPVIPHIEVSPPSPDTLWITITLKSPADLFVYDPQGRVIGKEGGNIPGATFETDANGHQIVSLPKLDSGEYRVVLRAIGEGGLCHLEVKGYKGNSELAAKETPFTIGAHETFTTVISADDFLGSTVIDFGTPDVPVSESGEPLNYDFNGDGTIDDADIIRLSSIWNKCKGDAEFDPFFDLDNDGCITVIDIMQVAK